MLLTSGGYHFRHHPLSFCLLLAFYLNVNYPSPKGNRLLRTKRLYLRSLIFKFPPDKSGNPYSYRRVHFAFTINTTFLSFSLLSWLLFLSLTDTKNFTCRMFCPHNHIFFNQDAGEYFSQHHLIWFFLDCLWLLMSFILWVF